MTDSRLVPIVTSSKDVLAQLRGLDGGPTPEEFEIALSRINRTDGPGLLFDYVFEDQEDLFGAIGRLGPIASVVHKAWTSAEYPEDALGADAWGLLFGWGDYRVDGEPADRPDSITLYRGAPEGRLRRMAWTSDRQIAENFATGGMRGRPTGTVWTAEVLGEELLAQINEREEHEYLVDPSFLDDIAERATPAE